MLGLAFAPIAIDSRARMNLAALEDQLRAGTVGTVVATLGATATGAVDPLPEILRLRERYGSDARLQAEWAQPGVTLDSAAIPSQEARFGHQARTFRDTATERPVIDFHRFWQDVMAETIEHFASVVKQATSGRKVVGAFYGYTLEFSDLAEDAGHLALRELLMSPDIDFVMAPSSYHNRNLPGQPYFRLPIASVNLHGKLFWNDFDQVSYKYYDKLKDDPNLKQWEWQMGLTQTPEQFVWMMRREVGMELAQGAQLAYFDIHGGYYEDPVIMQGVREVNGLREEALTWPDRGSCAEVLLLVDEASEHFLTFRNPITRSLLSAQTAVMPFVAPYDVALLEDCLLYTSPSPRDRTRSRMPSSA